MKSMRARTAGTSDPGILICDGSGVVLEVNDAALALCRATKRGLLGAHYRAIFPGQELYGRVSWRQSDGHSQWVRLTALPLPRPDGDDGLIVMIVDETPIVMAEARLRCEEKAAHALAGGGGFDDSAPEAVRILRDMLGWDIGGLWLVDECHGVMRCSFSEGSGARRCAFTTLSRSMPLPIGVDVPGRAWLLKAAIWEQDIAGDAMSPRLLVTRREGLRTGVAVPISVADRIAGAVELYSSSRRERDDDQLRTIGRVCARIGSVLALAQARHDMALAETRLAAVIDHLPAIICEIDRSGLLTLVEGSGLALLDLMPGDLVGQSAFVLFSPSQAIETAIAQCLGGRSCRSTLRLRGIVLDLHWAPRRDDMGEVVGVFVVASIAAATRGVAAGAGGSTLPARHHIDSVRPRGRRRESAAAYDVHEDDRSLSAAPVASRLTLMG